MRAAISQKNCYRYNVGIPCFHSMVASAGAWLNFFLPAAHLFGDASLFLFADRALAINRIATSRKSSRRPGVAFRGRSVCILLWAYRW